MNRANRAMWCGAPRRARFRGGTTSLVRTRVPKPITPRSGAPQLIGFGKKCFRSFGGLDCIWRTVSAALFVSTKESPMLSIPGLPGSTCDGYGRREFMRVGGAGLLGLSLAEVLRMQSARAD